MDGRGGEWGMGNGYRNAERTKNGTADSQMTATKRLDPELGRRSLQTLDPECRP